MMAAMSDAFFERLAAPVEDLPETLLDDPAIGWLDWKSEPEDIVHVIGERSAGGAVAAELMEERQTPELVLRRGGRREVVPLGADSAGGGFDRCVRATARLLGPDESVRLVVASKGATRWVSWWRRCSGGGRCASGSGRSWIDASVRWTCCRI